MFGSKQFFGGIAVAAVLAVFVPSALAAQDSWYGYAVSLTQQAHSTPFITDTLGGNGHAKQATVQGFRFITDTLGGNGHPAYNPRAYVYGGASPAVAQAIQDLGKGQTPTSAVTSSPRGTSFNWGIAAGIASGLLLLLLGGAKLRMSKRNVLTA